MQKIKKMEINWRRLNRKEEKLLKIKKKEENWRE